MHYDALVVLPALLGKLRINRPVLVGHSEGASIALIHAGTFRDESAGAAAGVAVMAPHLFVESTTVSEISNVRLTSESSGLLERLGKHHRDPLRTFSEWTDLWLSPAFQSWNIEQLVSEIRCPLLALHGRQDQYGTPRQVARLVELQPAAKALVLEDCRHSPHRDQPLAVLAALTGFLAGVGYVQEGPLPSAKSSAAGKPGDGPPGSG